LISIIVNPFQYFQTGNIGKVYVEQHKSNIIVFIREMACAGALGCSTDLQQGPEPERIRGSSSTISNCSGRHDSTLPSSQTGHIDLSRLKRRIVKSALFRVALAVPQAVQPATRLWRANAGVFWSPARISGWKGTR
jgi:hypothetical protein